MTITHTKMEILHLHHIVIKFSFLHCFCGLAFQFLIIACAYLIPKEPIELWGNILDLNLVGVWLCQFASRWGFNDFGFDHVASTPIRTIETIGNPKFVKHRWYESQSSDLLIFFDIFLIYIPKEIKFNYHYVYDIWCYLQNYCIIIKPRMGLVFILGDVTIQWSPYCYWSNSTRM
jgi:hypothetical protein